MAYPFMTFFDVQVVVEGMDERPTHVDVARRQHLVVQVDPLRGEAEQRLALLVHFGHEERQLLVLDALLEVGELRGADGGDVEIALLQAQEAGRLLGDGLQDDPLQVLAAPALPVGRILDQDDPIVGLELLDHVRAGSGAVVGQPVALLVFFRLAALLPDHLRIGDAGHRRLGEDREPDRVGEVQHRLDGVVVDDLGPVVHVAGHVERTETDRVQPVQRELDGMRVELVARAELDALADLEDILLAVGRDRPGLGQVWRSLEALVGQHRQGVVELGQHPPVAVATSRLGIEIVDLLTPAHEEHVVRARGRGDDRCENHDCQQGGARGSCAHQSPHAHRLLLPHARHRPR
jgi:hypothetical protein